MKNINLTLYAVTDRACLKGISLTDAVRAALEGGITLLQLREKDMPTAQFTEEAIEIKQLCCEYGVPLIINDNVEVCLKADADGVHLGQGDMSAEDARRMLGSDKVIGVTAKTIAQAQTAQAMGADYLGSGAVFGTSTKADAKKMDIETLKSICAAVDIPVAAIGGINAGNIGELKGSGVKGAAVVSGIFADEDIKSAARILRTKAEDII